MGIKCLRDGFKGISESLIDEQGSLDTISKIHLQILYDTAVYIHTYEMIHLH